MSQWLPMVTQALNGVMGVFAAVEYAREDYLASMTAALIGIFLVGYTKHMTKRQTEEQSKKGGPDGRA